MRQITIIILLFFAVLTGLLLWSRSRSHDFAIPPSANEASHTKATGQSPEAVPYRRIVSMAPSITETLYALGLGDHVAAVTGFCDYPSEAMDKPRIGGAFDINYEAIIALNPDLLILLESHREAARRLGDIGMEYLSVDQRDMDGILQSIESIAVKCGAPEEGQRLVADMRERLDAVEARTRNLPRPSVLLSLGRDLGAATLKDVFIAGPGDFHGRLIELAGGRNAYEGGAVVAPAVSAEGIIKMNPEVILELGPALESRSFSTEEALRAWRTLPHLKAVHNNRVHLLTGDYVAVPGPRCVQTLEDMARLIHSDAPGQDSASEEARIP